MSFVRRFAPFALLSLLAACATAPAPGLTAAPPIVPRSAAADAPTAETAAHRGLVSAADPRAAAAGLAMLDAGGTAADAAIATMLALNVVEPQSSGIGGGGFAMVRDAAGALFTLDGRETAPAAATPARFLDPAGRPLPFPDAVASGRSIGVPGTIALAADLHRRAGTLPWAQLFAPAIRLARGGFAVTPRLANSLGQARVTAGRDAAGRALFYDAAGAPLAVGTVVRNPAFADLLDAIAQGGPQAFYGPAPAAALAAAVVADTPAGTGAMTAADLAAYRAIERDPVCGAYRRYRICGMGPPSSGATTVYAILKQLEGFDLSAIGPNGPTFWHLFAESQRLAYADRERWLADPAFAAVPVPQLTDPAYLARRGATISATATIPDAAPGALGPLARAIPPDGDEPVENGTSHFVAIGPDGAIVSYTSTIESAFGSGLVHRGMYLNNELTDFSFSPARDGRPVANRVDGGKRPRSSMAPTIIFAPDGTPFMALGAAGGGTIPVQVARTIIGVIDFGLPLDQAVALPLIYAPGDVVAVEAGTPLEAMMPALRMLGHAQMRSAALPLKTNAAIRLDGRWHGAADPRSEGASIAR